MISENKRSQAKIKILIMTLTFDLSFSFFWTKDLKTKDPRPLTLMVFQLKMHITYIKYKRGNNSYGVSG